MGYQHICLSLEGNLAILTLNRPQRRNALSLDLMLELISCLSDIGQRREVRLVILAAAGKVFCSGHDLSEMVGRDINEYRRLFDVCSELMMKLQSIPQPVIAEVQGIATAAGCQLVATCDLAIAAEEAAFATPGVRIGLFCTTPMVALSRAVGRKRALEMVLTGDAIDARTALGWGLVNRVVPRERLEEETRTLARAASRGSTASKALGKRAFYETVALDVEAAYAHACEVMATSALTEDGREMMRAFLEKRPAVYPPRR